MLKKLNDISSRRRVKESRNFMENSVVIGEFPKDAIIEEITVNGISSVWITSPNALKDHVVLYLHGGGYISGSINSHKDLGARISLASESRVLLIEYRLAPEYPYPAALEDAVAAYKWLIDIEGINPKKIIIGGESAGGGLTAATLLKLRDLDISLPVAAFLLSPWTDLEMTGDSFRKNKRLDPVINASEAYFFADLYLGDNDPKNPYISPLYGDLKELPPLLIQVGSAEIILDDSTRFAEMAKVAGVEVTLEVWEDMVHGFHLFAAITPEGQQAIEKIGEFIQKHLKEEV
ncbi:MAG: alpha/beta hydrolase [Candidatus Hodarchaeota archaeon]